MIVALRALGVSAVFALVMAGSAHAQSVAYVVTDRVQTYQSLESQGLATTLVSNAFTETSVRLPFTFEYLGRDFDRLLLNSAGYLRFTNSTGSGGFNDGFSRFNDGLPDTQAPNQIIAPFWLNVLRGPGTSLFSTAVEIVRATEGAAPNRVFHVEYVEVGILNAPITTAGSFTVSLYEADDRFEVSYGGTMQSSSFTNVQGVSGFEASGSTSDEFGLFSDCSTTEDCDGSDWNSDLSDRVFTVAKVVAPELAVVDLVASSGARPGEAVTATVTVSNIGLDPALGVDIAFWLSTDDRVSPLSDHLVATVLDAGDVPQGTADISVRFDLPADVAVDQVFHLYPELDPNDELVEIAEDDNTIITDEPNFGTGPDIEILSCLVTTLPNQIFAGSPIEFEVVLANRGVPVTQSVEVELWASEDDRLDRSRDIPAGIVRTGDLPRQNEVTLQLVGQLPTRNAEPGAYLPICVVDPSDEIQEIGSGSNTFIGRPQDRFSITFPPLDLLPDALPAARVGQDYSYEFQVTGGTFEDRSELSFIAPDVPDGLELSMDGVLAGRPLQPTAPEGVALQVTVNDSGQQDRENYTLVIEPAPPLAFVDAELTDGVLGQSYAEALAVEGGVGQVRFALTSGELPPGLVLGIDGQITGVPTERGDFSFSVTAQDSPDPGGTQDEVTESFTVSVTGPDFVLTTSSLPGGTVARSYAASVETSGAILPIVWSIGGTARLPDGLSGAPSRDTATFEIAGTPARAESRSFELIATDAVGRMTSRTLEIVVEEASTPVCPGDPGCPDDPGLPTGDEGGGCTAASAEALAPWLLLVGALALTRNRRRSRP